ncbi:hypothetical protein M407DRAFT_244437, partial [Tulasnella calospora MUT 4182]
MSTLRPVAYFISEDVSTENMNSEDMAILMAHNTLLGALMEIHQTLVDVRSSPLLCEEYGGTHSRGQRRRVGLWVLDRCGSKSGLL